MTAKTHSGIRLKTFYTASDAAWQPENPGCFPFVRGIHEELYSKKPWTIRQYSGFGSAEQTNERYKKLIESGQEGLSVAFDLPTQMGMDPDDPLADGEVGKVGVSIATLQDFDILLKDIPLNKVSISMTINSTAPILMAFLVSLAKQRDISLKYIRGTVQNDMLKEFIARGTYIYDLDFSLRYSTDLSEYCIRNLPNFNWSSISGYHIREAGATAVQELAYTFSNAKVYFRELLKRGLSIEEILKRTTFFFDCMMDFFEEIAKFRAARRIYAKMVRFDFDCKDESCQKLKFHTQTGGSALTAQGHHNNIIRACLQSLAAVLGGTQSLHCSSYDEALGLPTEESARLALRTQQIIRFETNIPAVTDPLGGSYYVEWLTNQIELKVFELMTELEQLGYLNAIRNGYVKRCIEDSAFETQKKIESGEMVVVGVNRFIDQHSAETSFSVDEESVRLTLSRLERFKKDRDSFKVKEALNNLSSAKSSRENLFPYVLNCVECRCTLGEISNALK